MANDITIDASDLKELSDDIQAVREKVPEFLSLVAVRLATQQAGNVMEKIFERFGSDTKFPSVRTGALSQSFQRGVELVATKRDEATARSTSNLIYAAIHNRGGTIRAKNVRNLAIPLQRHAAGKWPRSFGPDELLFIISKKGNKLLIDKQAYLRGKKQGKKVIKPMFWLTPEVNVEARWYVRDAANVTERETERIVLEMTDEILEEEDL